MYKLNDIIKYIPTQSMYKIELGRKAVLKVDRFMVTLAAFRNVSFDIKIIAFEIKHDAETVNTVSNTGSQIKKN